VEYGVLHLKTPILFIFAHTNCGAVKAALFEYDNLSPAIKKELDYIRPAFKNIENIKDPKEKWFKGVLANLDFQVNYAYNKFKDLVDAGKLAII
jgi:carbonic anhydrase